MSKSIPHSRPTINSQDAKVVYDVIKSGNLAQGKKIVQFEKKFAHFQKIRYALATSSGTSALHLSLLAMNIKKGDNVIIPSFVCTSLLNAVLYTGAEALIVDIERDGFNISATEVKKKINKRTKAVIVPHMFGQAADMKSILKLKVPVIEDCAHSVGAKYLGKPVGTLGTISIYSFYATKMMTTGEGGMVCSNNPQLLNRIKDLREYDQKEKFDLRYNYKMTDFQAALGIMQLSKLPVMIKKRKMIACAYHRAFIDCDIQLPLAKEQRNHIYFRYVVRVKVSKDKLLKHLKNNAIVCAKPVFKPLHRYMHLKGYKNSETAMKEAVSIPIYPSLSHAEIKKIIKHTKSFLKK